MSNQEVMDHTTGVSCLSAEGLQFGRLAATTFPPAQQRMTFIGALGIHAALASVLQLAGDLAAQGELQGLSAQAASCAAHVSWHFTASHSVLVCA